jgi:dihydroxyacetone synthase
MDEAKQVKGKPTMINIRTIIGLGSKNQNTGAVHGAALGDDDVAYVKTQLGFHPDEKFVVPKETYDYFAETKTRGAKLESEWNDLLAKYTEKYPKEAKELQRRREGKLREGWEADLPTKDKLPKDPIATRKASGIAVQALVPKDDSFVAGSADLIESTFVGWKGMTEFQKVSRETGHCHTP